MSDGVVRIVSLFAGIGGMDLGALGGFTFLSRHYRKLNTEIALAVEQERGACSVYAENVGDVHCEDVQRIRYWPECDLVIGGPPCQPFSAMGYGDGDNDRRDMIPAFIEAIAMAQPRAFVMENVPGLLWRKHIDYFEQSLVELRALGYRIDHFVLNAADFGVPQIRKRLFVVGLHDGCGKFVRPVPTHGESDEGGLRRWVTVREALSDLSFAGYDDRLKTLHEGERMTTFSAGARRLVADRPMPTITATATAQEKLIHPWFDRYLCVRELKRGMGFPDDFILPQRCAGLGNAMPPVLAYHVVKQVLTALK